jgi:hypothetical protein
VLNGTPHGFFVVRKVKLNFAPQLGVAWDPKGNGNCVLRAGMGLYCENVVYNNFLIAPIVTKTGAFSRPASRVTEGQQCNGVPVVGRLDV